MAVSTRMRSTRAALGTLAAATLTAVAVTTTCAARMSESVVLYCYRGIVASTKRNVIELSDEDGGHGHKESSPVHIYRGANRENKF